MFEHHGEYDKSCAAPEFPNISCISCILYSRIISINYRLLVIKILSIAVLPNLNFIAHELAVTAFHPSIPTFEKLPGKNMKTNGVTWNLYCVYIFLLDQTLIQLPLSQDHKHYNSVSPGKCNFETRTKLKITIATQPSLY